MELVTLVFRPLSLQKRAYMPPPVAGTCTVSCSRYHIELLYALYDLRLVGHLRDAIEYPFICQNCLAKALVSAYIHEMN